jgi:hypothetical protein
MIRESEIPKKNRTRTIFGSFKDEAKALFKFYCDEKIDQRELTTGPSFFMCRLLFLLSTLASCSFFCVVF